jgi:hypothetical protein
MQTFNLVIQTLHNIARWGVVLLGLIAIVRSLSGWLGKKAFTPDDNRTGMLYSMAFDIQILLGIILYVSKGWFGVLTADFSAAMSAGTRFFAIEHLLMMILAAATAHIGRSQARKAVEAVQKHQRAALWYFLSFVLLLAAVPWPFMATARPWLRLFGFSF